MIPRLIIALLLCFGFQSRAATNFSIAVQGDYHAGTANSWQTNFQIGIDWILAHTNDGDLNIKGLIHHGDSFEQDTGSYIAGRMTVAELTNGFWQLITNGLFVFGPNGNHDCDADALTDWCTTFNGFSFTNVFPVPFYSNQQAMVPGLGYVTNRFINDSRQIMMTYTNGSIKLALLTFNSHFTNSFNFFPEISPFQSLLPQTMWITNLAGQYLDHNIYVAAHYTLAQSLGGINPTLGNVPWNPHPYFSYNDGIGYFWIGPGPAPLLQGFRDMPNLLIYGGGHTRSLYKGHVPVQATDGHMIDVQCFNTQFAARNGIYVGVITFKPDLGIIVMNTYNAATGRCLTNNDAELSQPISSNFGNPGGSQYYMHNWTNTLAVPRQKNIFRKQ